MMQKLDLDFTSVWDTSTLPEVYKFGPKSNKLHWAFEKNEVTPDFMSTKRI